MKSVISAVLIVLSLAVSAYVNASELSKVSIGSALWAAFDNQDLYAVHLSYEAPQVDSFYQVTPTLMLFKAEQGYSYMSVGLTKRMSINERLNVGVGSQIGFLDKPKLLGHKVEFYSRVFLEYLMTNRTSLSAELGHISNAGIGDINPGSESLVLSYYYMF